MHDFHSLAYVTRWAERVNNPVRESVFYHIAAHLTLLPFESLHVVELASGPGMLAEALLSRLPHITYEGLDYSEPMLSLAKARLAPFADRVALHRVDLRADEWASVLTSAPQAIISMQALHDVGQEEEHQRVYGIVRRVLAPKGLLLNADFMRRDTKEESPSRMAIAQHLHILETLGFSGVKCTLDVGRYGCVAGYTP